MARSHHRKKHKEHLRQFKHNHENAPTPVTKGKSILVFMIGGAIVGLMIAYFAVNGSIAWTLVGMLTGTIGGYLIGKKIDHEQDK